MHHNVIEEIFQKDRRYPPEAYFFVSDALRFTQLRREKRDAEGAARGEASADHVSARELLEGMCDYAIEEFGMLAPTVFRQWNIRKTDDFGEIVYNLIAVKKLTQSPHDRREDFNDVFDLYSRLARPVAITIDDDF